MKNKRTIIFFSLKLAISDFNRRNSKRIIPCTSKSNLENYKTFCLKL